MKRFIIVFMILLVGLSGLSYQLNTKADNEKTMITRLDSNYQRIGKVGDYTLYYNTQQQIFAQAFEAFYQDQNHIYYFRVIKSQIYRLQKGNETIGLKDALNEGKIEINDLITVLPDIVIMNK